VNNSEWTAAGERHWPTMKLMRWGLIPSWAKDESVGNAQISEVNCLVWTIANHVCDCLKSAEL